ncbi:hypothetical protein TCON_2005 [Astathelohania contejeani]|uniref:Uncharacterized protein n=1 Tax=Astathelohania contejeani TaxID=164912 RepID=A0ABQ7HX82_9MICR|nr:hypothetical protein TCON_2005 [Thelohania contejeani]
MMPKEMESKDGQGDEFESICASCLKPRQVMIVKKKDSAEYLKINTISKVKTGKHGAAKVMISGQFLGLETNGNFTYNGGMKISIVVPKRKIYVLIDFDEHNDIILVKNSAETSYEIFELPIHNLSIEDVEELKKAYKYAKMTERELTFGLTACHDYCKVDDIKFK